MKKKYLQDEFIPAKITHEHFLLRRVNLLVFRYILCRK